MKKHINKFLIASTKIRKEWVLCFLLAVGFIVACEGALEEGNPFGPSNSKIVIAQSSPQINKGGTQNFTAIGGTLPLSWNLSAATAGQSTLIGAIAADTGIFTSAAAPNQVAGTATVTVVDAVGDTDTATITVLPNQLIITPGSSAQALVAGTEDFTVTGGSGEFSATYTPAGGAIDITVTVVGAVVSAAYTAFPAAADGNKDFTITIIDKENGDQGSVVLTLLAPSS